jgi:type II secretory pathway component PulK
MKSDGAHSGATRSRGSTLLIVLWTVSLVSLVVVSVQVSALRVAADSRQELAQVRATWAARAGVERVIARLGWENENETPTGAFTLMSDLAGLAELELTGAAYEMAYNDEGALIAGPQDLHARLNVNAMDQEDLLLLPDMTTDVADAILDWIDADDEVREQGAEAGYYLTATFSYEPRNGPVRSLAELELIRGVLPEYVRGEDWNLNGRLDLNEDDGNTTWPPDNGDGKLDGGWSDIITARSLDGGRAPGGEEKLDLRSASSEEISARLGVDSEQAQALSNYASNQQNTLVGLIDAPLPNITSDGNVAPVPISRARPLSDAELRRVLAEATMVEPFTFAPPGKLNINTAPEEIFDYVPELSQALRDQIVFGRDRRIEGFESIVDLGEIPGINDSILAELAEFLGVRSNVYRINCRGRDVNSGLEVEIIATVDRSQLPIRILEYSIR